MAVAEISVQIRGSAALKKRLDGISVLTRGKAGKTATRKAAQAIAAAAAHAALKIDDPSTSESVAANIAVKQDTKFNRLTGDIRYSVGVLGGSREPQDPGEDNGNPGGSTWYWRLHELGFTLRDGTSYPAQKFMTNALAKNLNRATDVFVREYNLSLDRYLKRGIT